MIVPRRDPSEADPLLEPAVVPDLRRGVADPDADALRGLLAPEARLDPEDLPAPEDLVEPVDFLAVEPALRLARVPLDAAAVRVRGLLERELPDGLLAVARDGLLALALDGLLALRLDGLLALALDGLLALALDGLLALALDGLLALPRVAAADLREPPPVVALPVAVFLRVCLRESLVVATRSPLSGLMTPYPV
ncbi:MAG TPA: hypothetical protein VGK33_14100, partial [Chloroflexota bacterium]